MYIGEIENVDIVENIEIYWNVYLRRNTRHECGSGGLERAKEVMLKLNNILVTRNSNFAIIYTYISFFENLPRILFIYLFIGL